jgi:tetratricopeptide (TPR) repeat protein
MIAHKITKVFSTALVLVVVLTAGCTKQMRKDRALNRANRDFAAGDYASAEINYRRVLQMEENAEARRQLGILYLDRGQFPQAFAHLQRAAGLEPTNQQAQVKYGMAALMARDLPLAYTQALKAVAFKPTSDDAIMLLANTANTNNVDEVAKMLNRIQQEQGDRAAIRVALGTLQLFFTRKAEGPQTRVDAAEHEFRKALALEPKMPAAHVALAEWAFMRANFDAAEQGFKTAYDLAPLRSPWRLRYPEFKLRLSATRNRSEAEQTRDRNEAKRLLEEMTAKTPDYFPAWNLLARIAITEKRYKDAETALNRVLSSDRINYSALELAAQLETLRKNPKKAGEIYASMAEIYKNSPLLQLQLARAQWVSGGRGQGISQRCRGREAIQDQLCRSSRARRNSTSEEETTIPLFPAWKNWCESFASQPKAYFLLGSAYIGRGQQGDLERALTKYTELEQAFQKANTNDFRLYVAKAEIYVRQKKAKEARNAFEEVLRMNPDYRPALESLIGLDMAQERYSQAEARLEPLLASSTNGVPQILLAKVHLYQARVLGDKAAKAGSKVPLVQITDAATHLKTAEANAKNAIEIAPGAKEGYFLLADIYLAAGDVKSAENALLQCIDKLPDDQAAYFAWQSYIFPLASLRKLW